MTPDINEARIPVLDKVRKLLNLSRDSNNEHEAALAAQRAAVLMERHEIHEAELQLAEGLAEIRTPEPIDRLKVTSSKKVVAWHGNLAYGVAKKFHSHYYYSSGAITFFGRLSNIQACAYTFQYLASEVERQLDIAVDASDSPPPRAWRNAFRVGCASRIAHRLAAPVEESARASIDTAVTGDRRSSAPPPASAGVLAVIQKARDEVNIAYEKHSKNFGKARVGAVSNGQGYDAGTNAGNRANLGGSARGGLPRGQGVLK